MANIITADPLPIPLPDVPFVYDSGVGSDIMYARRYSVYTREHGHVAWFWTYAEASAHVADIKEAWAESL